jgi:hypothetical protein
MRILFAIVALAGLAWSGWWWVHASSRDAALERWLADRRDAGWVADASDVSVRGFPNRLDAVVTGFDLADPDSGWSWSAPEFQILSMTWKPNHVIAVWPGEQIVASPYETVRVESAEMRGSVVFEPGLGLTLARSTVEIGDMALRGESGWEAGIGKAVFSTRQSAGDAPEFAHDLSFVASDLTPPAVLGALDVGGVLPATVEAANVDATLVFDRDWNRASVEGENPRLLEVRLRDASVTWGSLDLRGQGVLTADARGYAEGEIKLRARNWSEMLTIAERSGAIPQGLAGPLRAGLDLIATLSGDRNTLNVPLRFDGGNAMLGPVVLGEAPRFFRP